MSTPQLPHCRLKASGGGVDFSVSLRQRRRLTGEIGHNPGRLRPRAWPGHNGRGEESGRGPGRAVEVAAREELNSPGC